MVNDAPYAVSNSKKNALIATAATVVAVLAMGTFLAMRKPSATFAFSREDLQRQIEPQFPVQKKYLIVNLTLDHPEVELQDRSDRIGLGLDVTGSLSGKLMLTGHVQGDCKLRYEPSQGALYLDDPDITYLEVPGLSPEAESMAKEAARSLVGDYLQKVPVYKLKPGDLRQDMARATLKSVDVKDGKLIVVVGVA